MVQELHNVVALSTLIAKWTDHMVIRNDRSTTLLLKKLMFAWLRRVPVWWPTPIEPMMEHPAALGVMRSWSVAVASLGLERCQVQFALTRNASEFISPFCNFNLLFCP
jgi:hypothetical protein